VGYLSVVLLKYPKGKGITLEDFVGKLTGGFLAFLPIYVNADLSAIKKHTK
jgi:hypothetical protein